MDQIAQILQANPGWEFHAEHQAGDFVLDLVGPCDPDRAAQPVQAWGTGDTLTEAIAELLEDYNG
jgi:hypothetical protein